ncbi:hypothetical protein [Thermogutta sp.]|jgi:hypothetical protein|uniref:hypothetical protein n=1 Tax=Thermogutta sp. TaxID=1962930 RepID=UPI00321F847E
MKIANAKSCVYRGGEIDDSFGRSADLIALTELQIVLDAGRCDLTPCSIPPYTHILQVREGDGGTLWSRSWLVTLVEERR